MQRVLQTSDHFGVQAMVCINKADLYPPGTAAIEAFCRDQGIEVVGRIPFDTAVTEAMVQGQPVTEIYSDSAASRALGDVWDRVVKALMEKVT